MEPMFSEGLILGVIIFIFAIFFLKKGVMVVSQADMVVIERLGKFHRQLEGGIHFIIPIVDAERSRFSSQEQLIDIPSQSVITKDNVSIVVDGVVYIRINNAKDATYQVANIKQAIAQLAQTTLRAEIGKLELDETLSSREELGARLLNALDDASASWGGKTTRVEIADLQVPETVQKAMELQLEAERIKRATETKAQGEKNAAIATAEGEKQTAILLAEAQERQADADKYTEIAVANGKKQAIEMINEAMHDNPGAAEFLLAEQRIEAFSKLAASDSANKIVVPVEGSDLVGSLTSLATLTGAGLAPITTPNSSATSGNN